MNVIQNSSNTQVQVVQLFSLACTVYLSQCLVINIYKTLVTVYPYMHFMLLLFHFIRRVGSAELAQLRFYSR